MKNCSFACSSTIFSSCPSLTSFKRLLSLWSIGQMKFLQQKRPREKQASCLFPARPMPCSEYSEMLIVNVCIRHNVQWLNILCLNSSSGLSSCRLWLYLQQRLCPWHPGFCHKSSSLLSSWRLPATCSSPSCLFLF